MSLRDHRIPKSGHEHPLPVWARRDLGGDVALVEVTVERARPVVLGSEERGGPELPAHDRVDGDGDPAAAPVDEDCLFLSVYTPAADDRRPPNIVLLIVDDLGYGELGCQGNPQIPTPHIDSIAAGGVRFTSGYVTASFCSPSRAAMMTGRYQTRFGHELNPTGKGNLDPLAGLPLSERTLADQLKAAAEAAIRKARASGAPDVFEPLFRRALELVR